MLPSSHGVHIEVQRSPTQGALLAEAFSDFISASARLELSYRELQGEVAELSLLLSERNRALTESLSETRSMGLMLERILDAMPCGVLVVNEAGAVRLVNAEAARLLDLSATEVPTLASIYRETGLDLSGALALSLACGGSLRQAQRTDSAAEQELSFDGCEGRQWIALRCVPLISAKAGAEPGMAEAVLMLRDISARKRMEREREAARDAVALAQVTALLAHEIRNPLASLELFAGLIADSPERREEWVSHLRAGIRSLSGTVNNVLTLHGGSALPTEPLDLAREAALAVAFLQPLAQQTGVVLRLEMRASSLPLRCNKSAFHQLLLNLCSNALRHTPAGGSVRVVAGAAERRPAVVRIAVIDTGCGIPEAHLPRLFEGGFSGSGTTPGLGLAVCERLMRQHGGTIDVQSRAGRGSTFTLEFPELPQA